MVSQGIPRSSSIDAVLWALPVVDDDSGLPLVSIPPLVEELRKVVRKSASGFVGLPGTWLSVKPQVV